MQSPWCVEAGRPILTDMFNHWFAQGAIPGSVTKGVITLLKTSGWRVWEGLDDNRLITLLNRELKILARVLANRLQVVISDLIGLEQTFAVKGRSIQDTLHFISDVLEVNKRRHGSRIDQFGDCRISTGVSQMDKHDVLQPSDSGAGERKAFEDVFDRAFGPSGLLPVSSSLCPRFGTPRP